MASDPQFAQLIADLREIRIEAQATNAALRQAQSAGGVSGSGLSLAGASGGLSGAGGFSNVSGGGGAASWGSYGAGAYGRESAGAPPHGLKSLKSALKAGHKISRGTGGLAAALGIAGMLSDGGDGDGDAKLEAVAAQIHNASNGQLKAMAEVKASEALSGNVRKVGQVAQLASLAGGVPGAMVGFFVQQAAEVTAKAIDAYSKTLGAQRNLEVMNIAQIVEREGLAQDPHGPPNPEDGAVDTGPQWKGKGFQYGGELRWRHPINEEARRIQMEIGEEKFKERYKQALELKAQAYKQIDLGDFQAGEENLRKVEGLIPRITHGFQSAHRIYAMLEDQRVATRRFAASLMSRAGSRTGD